MCHNAPVASKQNYDLVQARLGPELLRLFEDYRASGGFSTSEALRVLVARGLYREHGNDPGGIDEAAFLAAYANASQALVSEIRATLLGEPLRKILAKVARNAAKKVGVQYA